jgi:small subunit ribosomal protein S6
MREQRKHLYEGMYIVSATLSDDARQKMVDKLQEQITQRGGSVRKLFDWGRRRLAYDIAGRREGHYYILYFDAPTQMVDELWREYHLNEDLVRFATLKAESVPEAIEFKPLNQTNSNTIG